MPELLLLNGPNLGRLGRRRPKIYGTASLADVERAVAEEVGPAGWRIRAFQSNSEAELIDAVDHARGVVSAAIVNPGALMISGWSLRDALEDFDAPWIEVHLSNIWAREAFRHQSILSPIAWGVVCGFGLESYRAAARLLTLGAPPRGGEVS